MNSQWIWFLLTPYLILSCSILFSPWSAYASPSREQVYEQELKYPSSNPEAAPCSAWIDPQTEVKVALLCIHGLGLHKGSFEAFGKEMSKLGIATYALDMRGFGEFKDRKMSRGDLDFDGCLADIKAVLEEMHRRHPNTPVVILGESMGGAIALRAAALYPNLVSGLISSVPARDRFTFGEAGLKVGLHTIFGGYSAPMEHIGEAVVERATTKPELQTKWRSDPMVRLSFSPKQLLQFDRFMRGNFEVAKEIKDTPVLFIQGCHDRLIKPAGTWRLFERLATSNRQLVLSKTSEHLILEEGQFSSDDLSFVTTWIDRNIKPLNLAASKKQPTVVATSSIPTPSPTTPSVSPLSTSTTLPTTTAATTTPTKPVISSTKPPIAPPSSIAMKPPQTSAPVHRIDIGKTTAVNYWIELYRGGQFYRCNNKTNFQSGDVIRFHIIPEIDGYAYLVMREGSSGKAQMLFPHPEAGMDNFLREGKDYAIPMTTWLQFDETPGTEKLTLLFSKQPKELTAETLPKGHPTFHISAEASRAKDLVPTRMRLSWADPEPYLIPDDFIGVSQLKQPGQRDVSSLVHLTSSSDADMLAADVALVHR